MPLSNTSAWKLLFHSKITLGLIILATLVMSLTPQLKQPQNLWVYLLSIHATLSIIFSGYIGVGLIKFKRHHLWRVNPKFRLSLQHAGLAILGSFYLVQVFLMKQHYSLIDIAIIYPITSGICFAYYLLGDSLFKRLPIFLLGLAWTLNIEASASSNLIFGLHSALFMTTLGLYYKDTQSLGNKQQSSLMMNICHHNVNLPFYYKWSTFLNRFINHALKKPNPQKNIHWLINLPHNRCALMSVFYFVIITILFFLVDSKENFSVVIFCNLYVFTLVFNVLMESRQLLINSKSIAHLLPPTDKHGIKGKFIQTIDTTIIVNTLSLSVLVYLLISITKLEVNTQYFIASNLAIVAIGLAIYPVLLCFQWLKVSWRLIISIALYGLVSYLVCHWLFVHLMQPNESVPDFVSTAYFLFLIGVVGARQLSLKFLLSSPLERMLQSN